MGARSSCSDVNKSVPSNPCLTQEPCNLYREGTPNPNSLSGNFSKRGLKEGAMGSGFCDLAACPAQAS